MAKLVRTTVRDETNKNEQFGHEFYLGIMHGCYIKKELTRIFRNLWRYLAVYVVRLYVKRQVAERFWSSPQNYCEFPAILLFVNTQKMKWINFLLDIFCVIQNCCCI